MARSAEMSDGSNVSVGVDRISNLPDLVIYRILSFLPINHAFRLAIVSTTWKFYFDSMLRLHFDDELDRNCKLTDQLQIRHLFRRYTKFVKGVLKHCTWTRIESFTLKCGLDYGQKHREQPRPRHFAFYDCGAIKEWIEFALRRAVQELHLCVYGWTMGLPDNLFRSTSLVTLELQGDVAVSFSGTVFLPNLKNMVLKRATFLKSDIIEGFFSGCPVLESLVVEECCFRTPIINIIIPALKILVVDSRVLHKSEKSPGFEFVVDAPNLLYLKYFDTRPGKFWIKTSPTLLKEACIDIGVPGIGHNPYTMEQVINEPLARLLKGLHKAQSLNLSMCFLEVVDIESLSTFHYLKCLKLHNLGEVMLSTLLERTPLLETLVLHGGLTICRIDDCCQPSCLQFYLKTIDCFKFRGGKLEIDKVAYFLKNGKVLRDLRIHCSSSAEESLEQLFMLPRASEICRILIDK